LRCRACSYRCILFDLVLWTNSAAWVWFQDRVEPKEHSRLFAWRRARVASNILLKAARHACSSFAAAAAAYSAMDCTIVRSNVACPPEGSKGFNCPLKLSPIGFKLKWRSPKDATLITRFAHCGPRVECEEAKDRSPMAGQHQSARVSRMSELRLGAVYKVIDSLSEA